MHIIFILIVICTEIYYILHLISLIGTFVEMLKLGKYEIAQL